MDEFSFSDPTNNFDPDAETIEEPRAEPPTPAGMSMVQTITFAGMWVPTMIAGILAVFASLLQFDRWLMIFMVPTVWFFWKSGVFGWRRLSVRPYWAGFVSGFAGFILIPIYAIAGVAILAAVAQSQAVGQLREEVDHRLALPESTQDQTLVQTFGTGFGGLAEPDPAQSRYETCFLELFEGAGDETAYDQSLRRARRNLYLYRQDPEELVMTSLAKTCERHRENPINALEPYFTKVVSNAIGKAKKSEVSTCEFIDSDRRLDMRERMHAKMVVNQILCRMKEQDRDLLLMEMAGYSRKEMAEEQGISDSALRQRYKRAVDRAREIAQDLNLSIEDFNSGTNP